MASPKNQYTKEMYDQFGYFATWMPNVRLKLGDVGVFRKHELSSFTTLEQLGIKYRIRRGHRRATYEYRSKGTVSVEPKGAGEAPIEASMLTTAEAGVVIKFSRPNAIYFHLDNALIDVISDQDDVGKEILNRYSLGDWSEDYAVVTEVITAESSIVLISSANDGRVVFKTEVALKQAELELGGAMVGLSLATFRGIQTQVIGEEGLTPLFRARKVKRRFPVIGSKTFRSDADAVFDEMTYDDMYGKG